MIADTRTLGRDESQAKSLPPALSYSPLVVPLTYDVQLNPATDTPKQDEPTPTTTDESTPKPKVKKRRGSITLLRRDLYDARYQLISETEETDTSTEQPGLDFVDNPSDLVPGVYEGGLKTWECSLDLVDCLSTIYSDISKLRGKRIIEVSGRLCLILNVSFIDLSTCLYIDWLWNCCSIPLSIKTVTVRTTPRRTFTNRNYTTRL